MRISVSSDMDEPVARALVAALRERGHEVRPHGALSPGDDPQWAVCSEAAAREVAAGTADQAVVCCWTGTGAAIAANKVPGVRAALCTDAYTRSEEHTSELQSRENLVCRLLLEKKNYTK